MNSFCKIVFSITFLTGLHSAPVFCMDIFEAAETGNIDMVRELIEAVPEPARLALVNQQTNYGSALLHCAIFSGQADIIRMLLDAVPESARPDLINKQDNIGQTPLHCAAGMGHAEIARIIIDAIPESAILALVNQQDNNGETPLFYAAMCSHTEIARMLIANGADLYANNKVGQNPAQSARANNHPVIAKLIERAQRRMANARQKAPIIAQTMAQALHPRLGAASPVCIIGQDLLHHITRLTVIANEQAARRPEQAKRWCVVS
jgi:FOG: Ankyrin repeat